MTIAQQIGRIHVQQEVSQQAKEFANLARVIALSRGDPSKVAMIQRDHRALLGPRIAAVLNNSNRVYQITPRQKAAVSALDTLSGLAEYDALANAFLESLRNFGAFDRMLPFMRRVPFRRRIGASTAGASGATVTSASAKLISKLTLAPTAILFGNVRIISRVLEFFFVGLNYQPAIFNARVFGPATGVILSLVVSDKACFIAPLGGIR